VAWFRDPEARRLIARGYLPRLAALMLAWEIAHAPLYTLWHDAQPAYVAFSILHCTLGDVLIGGLALLLSLVLLRESALARWRWRRISVLTALSGAGYTVFSEWMNITLLRAWAYAPSMPRIELAGFELGLTPLLQWLVLPPLALWLARRAALRARGG
jgi:hypothetical protein